jgi:cytochrome c
MASRRLWKRLRGCAALLIGAVAVPVIAQALSETAPSFTCVQAERGLVLYRERCAACHGREMRGGDDAQALVGERFRLRWSGKPVLKLFETIRVTMPQDDPGTLQPIQAADLAAAILRENGYAPDETALTVDPAILQRMTIFGSNSP